MATERKALIKMKESAKYLTDALDGKLQGHGSLQSVAESFFELISVAEKHAMSEDGKAFKEAVEKVAAEGHD